MPLKSMLKSTLTNASYYLSYKFPYLHLNTEILVEEKIYVLVAEDDADDRYLLQMAFNDNAFTEQLIFVENGVEVMDKLNEMQQAGTAFPKIIILDLNMPKKDGRETLKDLKSSKLFKDIPVIIFSTTDNKNEIERCYALGANSYVLKPNTYNMFITQTSEIHNRWINPSPIAI